MKSANPSKALFQGALILALSGFITKILSAFYRIPFQNIVGDVGFYIYQQVYPFYAIAIVLTTTGFPVVISKLYAEQKNKKDTRQNGMLLVGAFLYLQLIGFICFIILYFGSAKIAQSMNDPKLAVLLKVVSIVFLTFPFVSVLRGYFQGVGDMAPTGFSQVGEQSARVLTIIVLAVFFTREGYSLYFAGAGAMFGSITGSIVATFILFTFLRKRKEWKIGTSIPKTVFFTFSELAPVFKAMTFQGLTICISGMLMIFIQMADSLNLYSLLVSNGMESGAAQSIKGVFDRGQPLIQLGTVAATSMALSLVPLISSGRLQQKPDFLQHKIQLAVKISLLIGLGASAGLWAIIKPANIMLFKNDLGSSVLGVLGFMILFASIISTFTAIMQGLGNLWYPAVCTVVTFPVKFTLNMVLVPIYGTMGAAISTLLTLCAVSLFLYLRFKKINPFPLFSCKYLLTVIFSALFMAFFLKGYLNVTDSIFNHLGPARLRAAVQALSAVFFGGLLYLFIVIRRGLFLEEELAFFPFGSKLIYLLPRKR